MTREEQIDWLCRLRTDLNNGVIFTPWNKEFTEALNDVLDQEPILDELRAEIEDLDRFYDNDYFSGNRDSMFKCNEVMEILDKHKADRSVEE